MLKYEYRAAGFTPSGQIATLTGNLEAKCDEDAWKAVMNLKSTWSFTKLNFVGIYSMLDSGERCRTPLIYESTPGTMIQRRDTTHGRLNVTGIVENRPLYVPPTTPPNVLDFYANAPWTRDFETSHIFNTVKIKDKHTVIGH